MDTYVATVPITYKDGSIVEHEVHLRPRIVIECSIAEKGAKGQDAPFKNFAIDGMAILHPDDSYDTVRGCLEAVRDATRQLHHREFLEILVPLVRQWAQQNDGAWRKALAASVRAS